MDKNSILKNINPKTSKKFKAKFLLVLALLVLLCAILWRFISTSDEKIIYEEAQLELGNISSKISANGTLSPTNEVSIGSVISGLVLEVLVDVNDRVKKGQILAKIDSENYRQNLLRYEAQLESAKAQKYAAEVNLEEKKWQYENLQNLYEKTGGKTPSILDLQSAKSAYNAALSDLALRSASIKEINSQIASIKIDIKNSNIISPIDGIVLSRSIEAGQSVAASFQAPEFFIIAESLEEMELKVSISEADIGKVKTDQSVIFSVDSYPQKSFNAVVERVNYSSQKDTTTNVVSYEARIFVDNSELLLRPGMSANAEIITQSAENVLLAPSAALYYKPRAKVEEKKKSGGMFSMPMRRPNHANQPTNAAPSGFVWVLEKGEPKQIAVELGISDSGKTQIKSDKLNEQSRVIVGQK